jgi:hypothetical protein
MKEMFLNKIKNVPSLSHSFSFAISLIIIIIVEHKSGLHDSTQLEPIITSFVNYFQKYLWNNTTAAAVCCAGKLFFAMEHFY